MERQHRTLDIKNRMITEAKVLGNSERGIKELASDLINQFGTDRKSRQTIANGTFLSIATIDRMASLTETEHGDPYSPANDTCERILRFFGVSLHADQIIIRPKYMPKPKPGRE